MIRFDERCLPIVLEQNYVKVMQTRKQGWVSRQLTPTKFSKSCLVVRYNSKLQSFCPTDNFSCLWP